MSVNKYRPHVFLIPEDDANRQLADGFELHGAIADRTMQVMAPAGGWLKVFDKFEDEYLDVLRKSPYAHVILLIDFDGDADRRKLLEKRIPAEVKSRVFMIGTRENPETLKREFQMSSFEAIGKALAQECVDGTFKLWIHTQLKANEPDLNRLANIVKPIVFSIGANAPPQSQ